MPPPGAGALQEATAIQRRLDTLEECARIADEHAYRMDRGEARLAALVRTHREKERKRIRMRDGKTGLAYRMVEREARRRTLRARAFRDLVREMVGKEKLLKKAMQDLALKLRKKKKKMIEVTNRAPTIKIPISSTMDLVFHVRI